MTDYILDEEKKAVNLWHTRFDMSKKWRESEGRKTAWENAKKYYRNFFAEDQVSVALIYSHGRQLIPLLYFQNPTIEITATTKEWALRAKIIEAVDNQLMKPLGIKKQLKLIIQDAFLYDYGIRKVGYDTQFGYDPTSKLWSGVFEELGIEVPKEQMEEFNSYVISETPFFLRVPPSRFLVDPSTEGPDISTSRWVAEEFYRTLDDVLEDKRYTIKDKDAIKPTYNLITNSAGNVIISPKEVGQKPTGKGGRSYTDKDRVRLIELWDKEKMEVRILAEGYHGYLREQEDVWKLRNFYPYDKLSFNPVSDEHYSTSDASYVERQQVELNDCRTQEMTHRRKENLKIIVRKNAFNKDAFQKLMKGEIVGIECNSPGPLSDNVMMVSGNMSRDIYLAAADIRSDFKEILAFGQNQMGQEMGRRKTAAEALLINQYVTLRGDERRDTVGDFLEETLLDINTLIFEFWDTDDFVKIVGPDGEMWQQWNGEFLKGNFTNSGASSAQYSMRVLINSTLPVTQELLAQKTEKLIMTYRGDPYIDQRELRRIDLDNYKDFDTSKLLLAIPDPTQIGTTIDFRPGQRHDQGSSINVPGSPEAIDMSQGMAPKNEQGAA